MENMHNTPLEKSEVEFVLKEILIKEFEIAPKDRQIEIHKILKHLNRNQYSSFDFEEALDCTRSDILSDHNIEID